MVISFDDLHSIVDYHNVMLEEFPSVLGIPLWDIHSASSRSTGLSICRIAKMIAYKNSIRYMYAVVMLQNQEDTITHLLTFLQCISYILLFFEAVFRLPLPFSTPFFSHGALHTDSASERFTPLESSRNAIQMFKYNTVSAFSVIQFMEFRGCYLCSIIRCRVSNQN